MIKDLQKFGKWLYDNNQLSFGKNVDENDYIFEVSYKDNKFKLESIKKMGEKILIIIKNHVLMMIFTILLIKN